MEEKDQKVDDAVMRIEIIEDFIVTNGIIDPIRMGKGMLDNEMDLNIGSLTP